MKTSARNELTGKVVEIKSGEVMTEVKIDIDGSIAISAIITNEGKEALGVSNGATMTALIKSSTIILSKDELKATARNNIKCTVAEVLKGQINSEIKLSIATQTLCAIITNDAADDLAIKAGDDAYAIFKASSVILVA